MDKITTNTNKFLFSFILAKTKKGGIGFKNSLPWSISKDMKHFKSITTSHTSNEQNLENALLNNYNIIKTVKPSLYSRLDKEKKETKLSKLNAVIMGRKTYESIPDKFKPLKDRYNIVLSENKDYLKSNPTNESKLLYTVNSFESAFDVCEILRKENKLNEAFIIGGKQIYDTCTAKYLDRLKTIYLTNIENDIECDVFYDLPENFQTIAVSETFNEKEYNFDFRTLVNKDLLSTMRLSELVTVENINMHKNHPELQYLDIIRDIIENGTFKEDRTGVGTISKFGYTMRFDCSEFFPLLTTKDTFWKGIVEELIWFIKGDTKVKTLQDKKVKIWDGNSTREYLDSIGLKDRETGDLGPVYGFQWRHSGAEYKTMHEDYTDKGVDQLAECIESIKNNPNSRRIIMCAWNPKDLKLMALPPCHVLCQFYVNEGKVSLQMYQRSCDMGLGIPFNIASYALLLRMVCQVTNTKPGEFIHVLGDAHVYKNHIEPLKTQLERIPRAFPKLEINPDVKDIEGFVYKDFKIVGYSPHPKIKMEMAV